MNTIDRGAARLRFPRARRLRKPAEFRAVYARGRKKTSRSFAVFILRTESPMARFGLTTPRKLGRAHERNRIRRRLREMLRRASPAIPMGMDVVINPRRSVLAREFDVLGSELLALLGEGS